MAALSKRQANLTDFHDGSTIAIALLLRSRALWLTVFTLMFLSWAWWDSERYRTNVELLIGSSMDFSFWTGDGGIPCILGRKVLITQDIGLAFIANYAIHAGVIKND